MAEQLKLDTPYREKPGAANVVITFVLLHWEGAYIEIGLRGSNNEHYTMRVDDNERNMLRSLNTMNLSVKSLHKRVMELMQARFPDFGGTIEGAPD